MLEFEFGNPVWNRVDTSERFNHQFKQTVYRAWNARKFLLSYFILMIFFRVFKDK